MDIIDYVRNKILTLLHESKIGSYIKILYLFYRENIILEKY